MPLCRYQTSPASKKDAASRACLPGSNHITRKGKDVAASKDETETILFTKKENPQIAAAQIRTAGDKPNSTPAEVATPLPPLKFSQGENTCPATAAIPVSTEVASPACRNSAANQTANHPFRASKRKTKYPHFFPRTRPTLVAPMLPLPFFWMSTPWQRAIQAPKGMDPIRNPAPKRKNLVVTLFGMGEEPPKGKEIPSGF